MIFSEITMIVGGLTILWLIVLSYKIGIALACVITAIILFFMFAVVMFALEQAERLYHWLVRKRMLP